MRSPSRYLAALAAVMIWLAASSAPAADSAVAVMYHRFGDGAHPSTNIRLDQFEAHLAEIAAGGHVVLPLPEIVAALRDGRELPEKAMAITVDDAYASLYRDAWPRLKAAGLPFTLFVATDDLDAGLPDHMSWAQIRELAAAGVTIGSQGAAHMHMAGEEPAANRADLERSRRRIAEELGTLPELLAWPYGEASAELLAMAAEVGFTAAFGQHSGVMHATAQPFYLPRFPLNESYGDLGRFRTAARALPLPAGELTPADPRLRQNPPAFGFTVLGEFGDLDAIACYASHEGKIRVERLGPRIEARAETPFPPGRGRINCTLPGADGRYRWLGYQYWVAKAPGRS